MWSVHLVGMLSWIAAVLYCVNLLNRSGHLFWSAVVALVGSLIAASVTTTTKTTKE